jgi:hypothetical protein
MKRESNAGSCLVMRAVVGNGDNETRLCLLERSGDGGNHALMIRGRIFGFRIHGTDNEHLTGSSKSGR